MSSRHWQVAALIALAAVFGLAAAELQADAGPGPARVVIYPDYECQYIACRDHRPSPAPDGCVFTSQNVYYMCTLVYFANCAADTTITNPCDGVIPMAGGNVPCTWNMYQC